MRSPTCARPSQSGFTLLEVMISLAIIAIALVIMLGLIQRSILVNQRLQMTTRATLLAKQKLAEIEKGIQDQNAGNQGGFAPPDEIFTWRSSYTPTLIDGVRQIDLRVSWGDEKDNEFVTLTSFLRELQR